MRGVRSDIDFMNQTGRLSLLLFLISVRKKVSRSHRRGQWRSGMKMMSSIQMQNNKASASAAPVSEHTLKVLEGTGLTAFLARVLHAFTLPIDAIA